MQRQCMECAFRPSCRLLTLNTLCTAVQPYFAAPDFNYDSAKKASGNVAGLCNWAQAMTSYHEIAKVWWLAYSIWLFFSALFSNLQGTMANILTRVFGQDYAL